MSQIVTNSDLSKTLKDDFPLFFFVSLVLHIAVLAIIFFNARNSFTLDVSSPTYQSSATFFSVSLGDDVNSDSKKITQEKNDQSLSTTKSQGISIDKKDSSNEVATVSLNDVEISNNLAPKYPPRAYKMNQQGIVLVNVLINEKGQKQEIKLLKSSNYPLLDEAALKAIEKWQFKPIAKNGFFSVAWVQVPVKFVIN